MLMEFRLSMIANHGREPVLGARLPVAPERIVVSSDGTRGKGETPEGIGATPLRYAAWLTTNESLRCAAWLGTSGIFRRESLPF